MTTQQPPVVTYERLTAQEMLERAFCIFKHQPKLYLTLSSVVAIPMALFGAALLGYVLHAMQDLLVSVDKLMTDQQQAAASYGSNPDAANAMMLQADLQTILSAVLNHAVFFGTILGFQLVVYVVLVILGRGAMIRATAEIYVNETIEPQWKQCLQHSWNRFCALFGVGFSITLGFIVLYGFPTLLLVSGYQGMGFFLLGLLLIATPWLYVIFYVRLALVFPAIVVENLTAFQGLRRAWELSANSFCEIFVVFFFAGVVLAVINGLVARIVAVFNSLAYSSQAMMIFSPLGFVTNSLLSIATAPYIAILTTVVYFNLRISKEGMNRDVLAREVAAAVTSTTTKDSSSYRGLPLMDVHEGDPQYEEATATPTAQGKVVAVGTIV